MVGPKAPGIHKATYQHFKDKKREGSGTWNAFVSSLKFYGRHFRGKLPAKALAQLRKKPA